ncbi:MAG: hypothetical protein COB35_08985 [Gammaproteobacteria bacterium]|nr:MAG: hypothetical protein COB35_08985 [Gammaproteobacteria bacterium]
MNKIIALTLLLISQNCFSAAEGNFYAEPVYSYQTTKFDQYNIVTHGVGINLGYEFSPNFAVEFRLGSGLNSDNFLKSQNFRNKFYSGVYLKGSFPLDDQISLYGLLGLAINVYELDFSVENRDIKLSDGSRGFASGFGFNIKQNKSLSYNVGVHYLNDSKSAIDAITSYQLGLKYSF